MRQLRAFSWVPPLRTAMCFLVLGVIPFTSAEADSYVHHTPFTIAWDHPTPGEVHHYNVYLSVDDAPSELVAEPSTRSYTLEAEDGRKYVIQTDAEDAGGNRSPLSEPLTAVVYLNGSAEDTDGDGMNNDWEVSFQLDPFDPADGTEDSDNDGFSNSEEFLAGTDPTNPNAEQEGAQDGTEAGAGLDSQNQVDNAPPIANAGEDQELDPTVVTLDGSGSSDPDGDLLSYEWLQLEGTDVELSDNTAVSPSFLGNERGLYLFELWVSDGTVTSLSEEVSVSIRNVAPTADAGPDQVVDAGTLVVLDGSGSQDPNEDALSCSWSQPLEGGPPVALDEDSPCTASFVPQSSGVYVFQLIASDGLVSSPPVHVQVVVNAINQVPTANAGEDQLALVSDEVMLDGSGSTDPDADPDTDLREFSWIQVDGPTVSLEGATSEAPTFTPSETGTYSFELVVSDGENASAPDAVNVTVENENRTPVAVVAEVDGPVTVGDLVTLDGGASYDLDEDELGYLWTQPAGAQVSRLDDDTRPWIFEFYAVTEGVLRFQLVVEDGDLTSAPAFVDVTVDGENQVPVADAGRFRRGRRIGRQVCLDASGSYDPDPADTLTYLWSQASGPLVTLRDHDTSAPCFVPSVRGRYRFTLIVSDGKVQSGPDTIKVNVFR